jgi:hypothetical protein
MKIAHILFPIAISILSLPLAPAALGAGTPLDIWTLRNPVPTGNQLNGVTHGQFNGHTLWAAVGVENTILTSSDGGNTWQPQLVPPSYNLSLSGVVCGTNTGLPFFVAVGSSTTNGTDVILSSPDGTNWTANTQTNWAGTLGLDAVAFGGGYFMTVGFNGENFYSTNGMTWTPGVGLVYDGDGDANGVTYGFIVSGSSHNPGFVAAADEGISTITLETLTNSGSWTQPTSAPSYGLFGIAYNSANGFVAVGSGLILNSRDGVTWYESTGPPYHGAVVFGNNEFVVVNSTAPYSIYTSPGGASSGADTWTTNAGNYAFDAIDWDDVNDIFVAVGPNGTVANSYNGTNWQPRNSSATFNSLNAVAYGANSFVAVGANGTMVTSANGVNWNPVNPSLTRGSLNAITYGATATGENLFLAGGTNTAGGPEVLTSPDGSSSSWSVESTLTNVVIPDGSLSYGFINALASGDVNGTNEFVALVNISADRRAFGGSVILSSSDATNWSYDYENSIFYLLNGIAIGLNAGQQPVVVAVGNEDTAICSTNLHAWTNGIGLPKSLYYNLNAVAYGNPNNTPIFVAVGVDSTGFPPLGVIFASADGGQTWQQAPLSGTASPFSSVTFANGFFVATTLESDFGVGGNVWVSPDGTNWTQTSVVASGSLNGVTGGDDQFIAVGSGGAILGSVLETVTGASFVGGVFTFTAYGPSGMEYGVYVSNDLTTWNFLKNVVIPSGATSVSVTDNTSTNYTHGYYYLGSPGP